MTRASGVGSLPGTDIREALKMSRDLLGDKGIPYLPELPARGPGADLIGRAAGLLVELPVDLQPSGWRFVPRPGRDATRTAALWRQDLDELAEAFDGWTGPLKLQVCGPWTLAATIELNRGERAVVDEGAAREIIDSLAEGIRRHLADVTRLVPGATLILQLDDPALPAVLDGRLPTASGYGRIRAVDRAVVRDGLRTVLAAAGERHTVIHCCAGDAPIPLLAETGARSLSLDTSLLGRAGWERLAAALDTGMTLYAGCLPTDATPDPRGAVRRLADTWERADLMSAALDTLVVTPACGLAGLTPQGARAVQQAAVAAADELSEKGQS